METDSNEMNIKTADLSPTEWHENLIKFLKEDKELSAIRLYDEGIGSMEIYYEDNDDKYEKEQKAHSYLRMIRMGPLFSIQPRLEKICKDGRNEFLSTSLTQYTFHQIDENNLVELYEKTNDLKYLLNICGTNFTCLDLSCYPTSQLMPIINANCPNLWDLALGFKEITSQDFENCFSNMPNLKVLSINWECKNSALPMTLAKSIERIGGTLKNLELLYALQGNNIFSTDLLALAFPRLVALERLYIWNFRLSQLLLQSISKMKNLADLMLTSRWPKNHPMFDTRINMYPIGNLKNLWYLSIDCDYGVTDEFLINLSHNAKKLSNLSITGTNITDIGMSAINNLEQLKLFDLSLDNRFSNRSIETNGFITDESVQCLFNQKLKSLNISNCINITDKSVIKLVKNLPNLKSIYVKNTKVTREAIEKIYESRNQRNEPIEVHYSSKNDNCLFSNY